MKTCKKLCGFFPVLVFVIAFVSAFLSCEIGSGDSFFVRCTLNGDDLEWTKGTNTFIFDADIDVPDDEPYGFLIQDPEGSDNGMVIIGTNDASGWEDSRVLVVAPADGIYSGPGAEPVQIVEDGTYLWDCDRDSTVTIDRFEDVGGLITGTFSGTDEDGNVVTDGVFSVRRVENYIGSY